MVRACSFRGGNLGGFYGVPSDVFSFIINVGIDGLLQTVQGGVGWQPSGLAQVVWEHFERMLVWWNDHSLARRLT